MQRRNFIKNTLFAGAALGFAPALALAAENAPGLPPANLLPRWRGFNLLEKFDAARQRPFEKWQFKFMRKNGFDFARLPLSYHCWMKPEDWNGRPSPQITNMEAIADIDRCIRYGKRFKIHINLNLHRIQGYCVNPPVEPLNLWNDQKSLDAACWQWAFFARRYKGISNKRLSFDLINEPAGVEEADYTRVVTALVAAIRREDPERLIVADGLHYGTQPVFGIKSLGLGQSTRGYNPMQVSHHKANWVANGAMKEIPTWPMTLGKERWDAEKLRRDYIEPWKRLQAEGVGIHVGEWGCYQYTPHAVALGWMEDCLKLWQEAGWGWSLWNLEGSFGIFNSGRSDVAYEDYKGRKLDRKMLELLKKY
jgi:endoglucanase